ncbi:MAG: electron transfer flavoprotein beta subunit [Cellvibrionaceae bacterium]|jgi:electron transfer flavoprotein beta subunit
MKILVAVKRVVDYNVKIRIKEDNSDVDLANTKMSMNPFCEIAIEEAIRIKERGEADEVIVVSMGPSKAEEQIRYGLALGADRGILVESEGGLSSLNAAKILKTLVDKEQPQLIILGKQAIDSDNNQTGQMLAALAGISQGTFASKVELDGGKVKVTREVDGGLQTLGLTLPAVITTDLRLNEPRYAKLPDIMKAKKKPLEKIQASELISDLKQQVITQKVEAPAARSAGIKVSSVAELVDKLKNEAKVIS